MKLNALSSLALFAVAALAIPSTLSAKRIDAGTVEIGGNLYFDTDTAFSSSLDMGLLGGYYVADGWLVGADFQLHDDDYTSTYDISLIGEHSFELGDADTIVPWIPYIGASIGYASSDFKNEDDLSGVVFGLHGGIKLMLTEDLAVDFSLHGKFGTDDVFYGDDGPTSTDLSIRIGLRTTLF